MENWKRRSILEATLLICHEKDGEVYFVVNSDEDLFRVALSILKGRFNMNWYSKGQEPKNPDFTNADIPKMPASFRPEAQNKLRAYHRELQLFVEGEDDYHLIKEALDKGDGQLAWTIIRSHSDREYEQISLHRISTSYLVPTVNR
jgi:hypothetical protein